MTASLLKLALSSSEADTLESNLRSALSGENNDQSPIAWPPLTSLRFTRPRSWTRPHFNTRKDP